MTDEKKDPVQQGYPEVPIQTKSLKWPVKTLIGFLAGICISVVILYKIWPAGMVLSLSVDLLIGKLIPLVAFPVLSMIFVTFVEEKTPGKLFMHGLLAPSMLFTLVGTGQTQGVGNVPVSTVQSISVIGSNDGSTIRPLSRMQRLPTTFFISSAYAEEPFHQDPEVLKLTKNFFQLTVGNGIRSVFGRYDPSQRYVVVVGKTNEFSIAKKLAKKLKQIPAVARHGVKLIKPVGSDITYVSIGLFSRPDTAFTNQTLLLREVLRTPPTLMLSDHDELVRYLEGGVVVDGLALVQAER